MDFCGPTAHALLPMCVPVIPYNIPKFLVHVDKLEHVIGKHISPKFLWNNNGGVLWIGGKNLSCFFLTESLIQISQHQIDVPRDVQFPRHQPGDKERMDRLPFLRSVIQHIEFNRIFAAVGCDECVYAVAVRLKNAAGFRMQILFELLGDPLHPDCSEQLVEISALMIRRLPTIAPHRPAELRPSATERSCAWT